VGALEVCLIILIAGLPWIAGIVYYLRKLPAGERLPWRRGAEYTSMGEYLRRRMGVD
jgi:hypothetical protein